MKKCDLVIQKLSMEQPVLELKATAIMDGKELVTIYSRSINSSEWSAARLPDYKSQFTLDDDQANDIKIGFGGLVYDFVNGVPEPDGHRSLLQCSTEMKKVAEMLWE